VPTQTDVVVIGAGQAGLSAAFYLLHHGVDFVVLDGEDTPGGAWAHRWPTLRMANVHGLHPLPGSRLPDYDGSQSASSVVPAYFAEYERHVDLPIRRPVHVPAVRRGPDATLLVEAAGDATLLVEAAGDATLLVEAAGPSGGTQAARATAWQARAVINATGTWARPFWPHYPGMTRFAGRQLHAADYTGPEPMRGQRVVVVGGGTSAVQLLAEIADVAADTTWVTRRPPTWHRGSFTLDDGRAAVSRVAEAVRAGRPPASVVAATGLTLTPTVEAARDRGLLTRRPMFDRITPTGVAWTDGRQVPADVIVWATGFRPVLDHLAPLHLREPGGGIRMDGAELTQVARLPQLHLVGYGPSASTIGATRAGRAAVAEIRQLISEATAA